VDLGEAIEAIFLSETYESHFFTMILNNLEKQHLWYKAILSSVVLPQQCC